MKVRLNLRDLLRFCNRVIKILIIKKLTRKKKNKINIDNNDSIIVLKEFLFHLYLNFNLPKACHRKKNENPLITN
ncbi:hypothetical protein BpHYR1_052876 [Brachionus plicatilis]|uniref:Uncharacterized protein n=1 Tax=Brachionus plicatilis TaxID=10195 RepID=A0A3M7RIQ2_BRAPC|nr:hypothetical protein BpHYR1_052876 [Brachionus plicatilis]